MDAPAFWDTPAERFSALTLALTPLSWLYSGMSALRGSMVRPVRMPVPVVCVGNLVAGGAGKTPTAIAVTQVLAARGLRPHLLTRGYGGTARGPLRVDPGWQDHVAVGDEALLLARVAPTWVGRDRVATARAAVGGGANVLVLDDGFQNPSLVKDVSLVVVDAKYGFGNGRILPAGPLRESVAGGLARADAIVLIGEADTSAKLRDGVPALRAAITPTAAANTLIDADVFAFAGIGRPAKFFDTLRELPANLRGTRAFPDHHRYAATELAALEHEARDLGARLVTTSKDWVRLPAPFRAKVEAVEIELSFVDAAALVTALAPALRGKR